MQYSIEIALKFFGEDTLADVVEELNDARYANRQHGSRATAALRCRGPLCRKSERDRSRRRNELRATRAGREFAEGYREYDRDDFLDAVIRWHKEVLARRRVMDLSA